MKKIACGQKSFMSTENGVKGFRKGLSTIFIVNFMLLIIKGIFTLAGGDFNMTITMIMETCIIGLVLFALWFGSEEPEPEKKTNKNPPLIR